MVVAKFADLFNDYDACKVNVVVNALTQGIRTIKTFIKCKKCYCQ